MAIHWSLVSSAVFAGGADCNPPGTGREVRECGCALHPWRCGGVEKDAARNGPGSSPPQSLPEAAARGPRPRALKGEADGRAPGCPARGRAGRGGRTEHPERPAAGLQPRCAFTLRGPRCVGPFSPRLSIIQSPPRPYSSLLPPPQAHPACPHARPIHPHPCAEPSSPRSSCSRHRLGLRGSRGPRPSPQTGGEGRWDNPPSLRSRAPSRMGVAWLRPGPQHLTSCLSRT